MTASVYWLPDVPRPRMGKNISYLYEPSVKEWLLSNGLKFLTRDSLPYLQGRADSLGKPNAWQDLASAVEKHDSIRVWIQ